jgi:hypothetical protein
MSKKNILVLGSKPGSMLPNIKVEKIYTANGAAEKAQKYLERFPNTPFTAVIGGREFEINEEVQKRVIKSHPDILLSRSGSIKFEKYDFPKKTNYEFFSFKEALFFQSQFFKLNILDILIKEFYYEEKISSKIIHVLRLIKDGKFGGVSTGFFSILHALKLYPESDIIISGIGMSFGGHFYDKKGSRYNNRSKVDIALMKNLKKKFKNRLYTLDVDLNTNTKINLFKLETF